MNAWRYDTKLCLEIWDIVTSSYPILPRIPICKLWIVSTISTWILHYLLKVFILSFDGLGRWGEELLGISNISSSHWVKKYPWHRSETFLIILINQSIRENDVIKLNRYIRCWDSPSLLWTSLFPPVVRVFFPLFMWLMVGNGRTAMRSFLSNTAAEWSGRKRIYFLGSTFWSYMLLK